jgi:putative membrane protein
MLKEKLLDFLKGIIIGIANIMPGFSGGIMAVSFNVYDRIISAVSNFFSKPLKIIKDVWALALGGVLGIVLAILAISFFLDKFPIPTVMLFIGLIVGSIPTIFEKVKAKKYSVSQIIAFFAGIVFIVSVPLFAKERVLLVQEIDLGLVITLFFLGIVAAATMVIPGVSGSLILLAFGYYIYIVALVKDFLKAIIFFDKATLASNVFPILALAVGILIGVVLLAKLVEKLLKKRPKQVYSAILGMVCSSPFAIIYQLFNPGDPETAPYREALQRNLVLNLIIGVVFLAIGVIIADLLSKFEKHHPTEAKLRK